MCPGGLNPPNPSGFAWPDLRTAQDRSGAARKYAYLRVQKLGLWGPRRTLAHREPGVVSALHSAGGGGLALGRRETCHPRRLVAVYPWVVRSLQRR